MLSQQSTYFKAFFSSPWRKPKLIRGPNGEEKEVWELDLFFDKELSIATLVGDVSGHTPLPALAHISRLARLQERLRKRMPPLIAYGYNALPERLRSNFYGLMLSPRTFVTMGAIANG